MAWCEKHECPTMACGCGITPPLPPKQDPSEYPGLEHRTNELAALLQEKLPKGSEIGFTLFLFHYGPDGGIAYASNAERETMISAMVEFIARQAENGHADTVLAALHKFFNLKKG